MYALRCILTEFTLPGKVLQELDADIAFGVLFDVDYEGIDVGGSADEIIVEFGSVEQFADVGVGVVELFGELVYVAAD